VRVRLPLIAALWVLALMVLPATLGAAPQESAGGLPVSLDRIRDDLQKPPSRGLMPAEPVQLRPTFKARADQRTWVPTLQEHLHQKFDLSPMQRQSADWAARCCGLKVGQVIKMAEDALRARKVRKTREQIARELALIEAAALRAAQR